MHWHGQCFDYFCKQKIVKWVRYQVLCFLKNQEDVSKIIFAVDYPGNGKIDGLLLSKQEYFIIQINPKISKNIYLLVIHLKYFVEFKRRAFNLESD